MDISGTTHNHYLNVHFHTSSKTEKKWTVLLHLSLQTSANDYENVKYNYLFLLIGFHVAMTLLEGSKK